VAASFLDTNVILRHLCGDNEQQSPRATAYLARVERGEIQVRVSDIVVFEVVYTLQRSYRNPEAQIREALLPLLELPGIILPGKRGLRAAFDLYVEKNISFADAYHAVLMKSTGMDQIVSFDREFDRVPGIERVEP
jgi:uncharacterized protein